MVCQCPSADPLPVSCDIDSCNRLSGCPGKAAVRRRTALPLVERVRAWCYSACVPQRGGGLTTNMTASGGNLRPCSTHAARLSAARLAAVWPCARRRARAPAGCRGLAVSWRALTTSDGAAVLGNERCMTQPPVYRGGCPILVHHDRGCRDGPAHLSSESR
jgi:hypothetical protein